jgi:hypothetical protein
MTPAAHNLGGDTHEKLPICKKLRAKRKFRLRDDGPVHESLVNPDGPEAADTIEALVEALSAIASQAICYGMSADETELRDWLKFISETAETALFRARNGGQP